MGISCKVKIIVLYSTDPERLIYKEGSREDALISLGKGIGIDFMGELELVEREQKGSGGRWRERILAETTGIGQGVHLWVKEET